MIDPVTAIAATKAVADALKALYDFAKNKQDPALMAAVADLQAKVVEQGTVNLGLQAEVMALRLKVADMEHARGFTARIRRDGILIWLVNPAEGPFCGVCHGKGTGLLPMGGNDDGNGPIRWFCNTCNSYRDGGSPPKE